MNETLITHECAKKISPTSNPAVGAWLGMARLVQRTERLLTSHMKCHRLNAGQLDVLLNAGRAEGLTQQELAERLCHSKANVSQLLDKMERAGFVRRVPEGRAYQVFLTDNGRALLQRVMPEQERIIAEQFDDLQIGEKEDLYRLVEKLEVEAT